MKAGSLRAWFDDAVSCAENGDTLALVEGRLANARELARELGLDAEARGAAVLAAGWEAWGEELLHRLRGGLTGLLWDRGRDRGLLFRDQLGGGALFHFRVGEELLFATEVAPLLRMLARRPSPDEVALVHWLAGAPLGGDHTVYEGVRRLRPAHALTWGAGGWRTHRYWAPSYTPDAHLDEQAASSFVRDAVSASVRRQQDADEPGAVLLSGGLDSSAVAAVGVREGRELNAYSAVFPDQPAVDESALIGRLATDLGLTGSRLVARPGGLLAGALDYVQEWELPLPVPNHALWRPLLLAARADGARVVLDGEGGDELFGAAPFLLADLLRSGRFRSALALTGRFPGIGRPPPGVLVRMGRRYGLAGLTPHRLHVRLRRARGSARHAPAFFRQSSANLLLDSYDPWAWKRSDGPRWWAQLAHVLTDGREALGVPDYLRRRAQETGLEDRHPFLDLDLVGAALRLPPELGFDPALDRPLLRRALVGLVPDYVRLRREKSYFDAFVAASLAGPDMAGLRRLLGEGTPEVTRWVDAGRMRTRVFEEGSARDAWRLATAECWLRSQGDPDFVARSLDRCRSPGPVGRLEPLG